MSTLPTRLQTLSGRVMILCILFPLWLWGQKDSAETARLERQLQTAESPVEKAKTLLALFKQYKQQDFNKAAQYNEQVLAMIPDQLKQKDIWATAYLNKAIHLFLNYKEEKAVQYCLKAIHTVPESQHPLIHAEAYNLLTVANQVWGNVEKTFECAYRALELCKEQSADAASIRTLVRYNLALNYINLSQYKEAEYMIQQNAKDIERYDMHSNQARDLNLLAQIAQRRRQYHRMIQYSLKSIKQRANRGPIQDDINAYIMLHIAHTALKKDLNNLYYLKKAKALTDSIQDIISSVHVLDLHSNYYLDRLQLDSALALTTAGLAIARKNDLLHFHLSLLYTHAEVLKKLGQHQASLNAFREYYDISTRIESAELKQQTQQQLANYQLSLSQEKINQRYQKKIKEEGQKRSMGIAICLLALLLGGVGALLYRQRVRSHQALLQKQQFIAEQAAALQSLNEMKTQLFGTIATKLSQPMAEIRQVVKELHPGLVPVQEQKILLELREHTQLTKSVLTEVLANTRKMIVEENQSNR